MNDAEPGLFELPDPAPRQAPPQRAQSGRDRETWARTAVAEVSIIDAAAVDEAAARAEANAVTIGSSADSVIENPSRQDAAEPVARALDQLAWLADLAHRWPGGADGSRCVPDRLREMRGGGRVPGRGKATWTVTVKLTDVDRLRRLATQAVPDEAALIENNLAPAWQRAADPFAPLRCIPGVAWRPVSVDVERLPA